jgi:hypothetical protein
MATLQGLWRTGIFKVKDGKAFAEELKKYDVPIDIRFKGENELILVDTAGSGCIPEFYYKEYVGPEGGDDLIPWVDIFKQHLEPGTAVVFFAVSYCKEASLSGETVIYDSEGRRDHMGLYTAISMMDPTMSFRFPEEGSTVDQRYSTGTQDQYPLDGINPEFQARQSTAVKELLQAVRLDFDGDKSTLVENCCIAARVSKESTGAMLGDLVDYLEQDILDNPEAGKSFNGYRIISSNRAHLNYQHGEYSTATSPKKWKEKIWPKLT